MKLFVMWKFAPDINFEASQFKMCEYYLVLHLIDIFLFALFHGRKINNCVILLALAIWICTRKVSLMYEWFYEYQIDRQTNLWTNGILKIQLHTCRDLRGHGIDYIFRLRHEGDKIFDFKFYGDDYFVSMKYVKHPEESDSDTESESESDEEWKKSESKNCFEKSYSEDFVISFFKEYFISQKKIIK